MEAWLNTASEVGAQIVDQGHDEIDGKEEGEELIFKKETDRNVDLLAQSASPDESENRRRPDVHLLPVE